jgi:hypothetical protein
MTAQTITDITRRFATEGAGHSMEIVLDNGLHRHLRFRHQGPGYSGYMWFDLITVPGTLIFQGDGDSYVFSRMEDMFQFFRGKISRIDPHYWAEKLTSRTRDDAKTYDEDLFKQLVTEHVEEAVRYCDAPAGLVEAVREQVLNDGGIYYESGARDALESFEHDGFRFSDVWEWDFRCYDWWFLWACHAIVWGIALYDAHKAGGERPTFPAPPEPSVSVPPSMEPARPMVTVQLPGGDSDA